MFKFLPKDYEDKNDSDNTDDWALLVFKNSVESVRPDLSHYHKHLPLDTPVWLIKIEAKAFHTDDGKAYIQDRPFLYNSEFNRSVSFELSGDYNKLESRFEEEILRVTSCFPETTESLEFEALCDRDYIPNREIFNYGQAVGVHPYFSNVETFLEFEDYLRNRAYNSSKAIQYLSRPDYGNTYAMPDVNEYVKSILSKATQ